MQPVNYEGASTINPMRIRYPYQFVAKNTYKNESAILFMHPMSVSSENIYTFQPRRKMRAVRFTGQKSLQCIHLKKLMET